MLNKVILQGRLVADPDVRKTGSGVSVTTIRIAVDRDFKSRNSDDPTADFISVTAWRNTADFLGKYFSKGRMILVEGRLQVRPYTDRDGNKRTSVEVVADNVYFGDSKRDSGSAPSYSAPAYSAPASAYDPPAAPAPVSGGYSDLGEDDGDLPF